MKAEEMPEKLPDVDEMLCALDHAAAEQMAFGELHAERREAIATDLAEKVHKFIIRTLSGDVQTDRGRIPTVEELKALILKGMESEL